MEDIFYSQDIQDALKNDPFAISIAKWMNFDEDSAPFKEEFNFKDRLFYYNGLFYVSP